MIRSIAQIIIWMILLTNQLTNQCVNRIECQNLLRIPVNRKLRPERSHPEVRAEGKKTPRIYERFRKIPEKIKYTFRRICDKISTLKKKKERIAAFLRSSTHQNAFSRLIKELKRLFHFLKPSDASVDLEFGFSDPAYTGYTLAGISMIYPMIGEYAQIKPDFEHKVLKGKCLYQGKDPHFIRSNLCMEYAMG